MIILGILFSILVYGLIVGGLLYLALALLGIVVALGFWKFVILVGIIITLLKMVF